MKIKIFNEIIKSINLLKVNYPYKNLVRCYGVSNFFIQTLICFQEYQLWIYYEITKKDNAVIKKKSLMYGTFFKFCLRQYSRSWIINLLVLVSLWCAERLGHKILLCSNMFITPPCSFVTYHQTTWLLLVGMDYLFDYKLLKCVNFCFRVSVESVFASFVVSVLN